MGHPAAPTLMPQVLKRESVAMTSDSRVDDVGGTPLDAITMTSVAYSYDGTTDVLRDLTLNVRKGEILGVIGPSGCGKSTLLRLVAEFVRPRDGEVSTHIDPTRRGCPLSMMFQTDTTLPWLTAEQNVLLFARFKRWRRSLQKGDLHSHGRHMLDMVHLGKYAHLYPYQMSGGMKRRLSFATAVAPLPEILLLDEPFSSVDEPTRVKIHRDVFSIVKELGLTTMLVTHDLAEALTLCDRVVVLTRAPTQVFSQHEIPFGDSRDILQLRNRPEFLELYGNVWHDLSLQL